MIEIQNFSKTFQTKEQSVHALRDVSLNIQPGEIYGVIGVSGAGKSTLIRCLNFLEIPDEGTLIIEGYPSFTARHGQLYADGVKVKDKDLRKLRQNIGMIFQHFNLLERKTVSENIAYALEGTGRSRKEIKERVQHLLELIGMTDKADSYPGQLSGGQKQRVAIARAIAPEPKILLCDEATSALDPEATANILSLLSRLNRELGLTIILITHEMAVIKSIAHQVAVMENGRVVEQGSVYELFAHPKHPLTKKFIAVKNDEEEDLLDEEKNSRLLELHFDAKSVSEPLICQLARTYPIEINILRAHIDRIQQKSLGTMLVSITGEDEQIQKAIETLKASEVEVEEVSYA